MKVTQVKDLVNTAAAEATGQSDLVKEDLSDLGMAADAILNANAMDNYVKSLVNHIGRVIFVDRVYTGSVIDIVRDGWEYGSILQKVSSDLLSATENESWKLQAGMSYDPNIFTPPTAEAKFWNHKLTYEIDLSITTMQVKESFSSAAQLNGFVSMIYNTIAKSNTVKLDELIMRVINDMIAKTIYAEYPNAAYTTKSGVRAINLLYLYNQKYGTNLTADKSYTDPDFVRFASYQMSLISERMMKINNIYNIGGKSRFTPRDMQHIVMLSDFAKAASIYLYSDTFHNEFVTLPNGESVPFWQGSGTDYAFDSISTVNVTDSEGHDVNIPGVLAIIFDRDAAMVANHDSRVTSNYNPRAEFTNFFYKEDVSLFNDPWEQFVVFFVA